MRDRVAARTVELSEARVPFVHATVVRAQHPTSAHAGDTALVHPDGRIEGFVGGVCAESSLRLHALEALRSGEPLLLRVAPGAPGTTREEGAVTVANPCLSGGTLEIFLEPRSPAPRVVVVGDTPIARALADTAGLLGFAVELADGRATPGSDVAAVVVASHGRGEEAVLEAALRAGVPYVGLVASRTRGEAVLGSLGVDHELRGRVHSPAGLALGARTPAEIALSILAEIVSERARLRAQAADVVADGAEAVGLAAPADAPVGPAPGAGAPVSAHVPASGDGPPSVHVPAPRTPGTTGAPETAGAPAAAVDPVCGMTVAVTADALSAEHDGRRVWFCGAHCRASFVGDPVRYAVAS